jgi:hypothetical protein
MIQSIPFSSLSSLSPQTIKGYDCDGIVDDKPVRVRYNRFGGVVPTVGSTILTTYGVGKVTGYNEGSLIVAITKFNDEYIFITADGEDCYDAIETVEKLSQCANRNVQSLISDVTRLYKSEITGNLPKSMQEKVDRLRHFDSNEFIMNLTDKSDSCQLLNGSVLVDVVATERETKAERNARIKAERELAIKRANALLAEYDEDVECPDDVAAEIAEEMGDVDFEF